MALPLILLMLLVLSPTTADESDALLKLKDSFTNAGVLDSWAPNSRPCGEKGRHWVGLICDSDSLVIGIHLGRMRLSGKIDVEALLKIPNLRTIYLADNSFSGSIPELNRLGALKAIYLSDNQFSGEIPADYFGRMDSLKKLWLDHNNFTGKIPKSLARLKNLAELHLEQNKFSGAIPHIELPNLNSFNVSNNELEGEIPAGLTKFKANSFAGNDMLTESGEHDVISPSDGIAEPVVFKKDHTTILVAMLTMAVMLVSIAVVLIIKKMGKTKVISGSHNNKTVDDVALHVKEPVLIKKQEMMQTSRNRRASSGFGDLVVVNDKIGIFAMTDLMKATAEVMGNCGVFGLTYKAVMENGVAVAVKRTKEMNAIGKDEFELYVRRLGKLRHTNIMPILAYHCRKDELLVVSEFIPMRSLLHQLHGEHGATYSSLDWPIRLKIVKGIARGIGYLHTELGSCNVPHGNLKSSNVLISPDYDPLLSDYGLNTLLTRANAAKILFAYKTPEATQNTQLSPKSDVYCLGIIILEILTCSYPSQYPNNNVVAKAAIDAVQWAHSAATDEDIAELLDPDIAGHRKSSLDQMLQLLKIGISCTESDIEKRLDAKEAIKRIEGIKVEGGTQFMPSLRNGIA